MSCLPVASCALPAARLAVLLAMALAPVAVAAGEAAEGCALEAGPAVRLQAVGDAQTVALAGGEAVRLLAVLPPDAAASAPDEEAGSALDQARAALAALIADGGTGELRFAGPRRDRHGRWLAHLFVHRGDERVWVQERLVADGQARVFPLPGSGRCLRHLQAVEARARAERRGLWRWPAYAPVPAERTATLLRRRGRFQLVEGEVRAVADTRRWTFVNFGADWRRDFTIAIAAADRAAFAGSDIDLARLAGQRVRVRGWIESWNGPVIKVTDPAQIERLGAR